MKIIVRGILQKLAYWTIRRRNDCPSNPAYYIRDSLIFVLRSLMIQLIHILGQTGKVSIKVKIIT